MVRRRRTPSAGTSRDVRKPETVTSAALPPDSPEAVAPEPAMSPPSHDGSLHDTFLESVSPEALQLHPAGPETAFAEETRAAPDAPLAPQDAPVAEAAPEQAPTFVDGEPEAQAANDSAPLAVEELPQHPPEPSPASVVVPARPAATSAFRKASALDAIHEVSESNATLVAFLRNEGSATLAHWRSLAKARSAADVVRLQVDEMQRAADASLTCVSTLARRAGRFANLLSRR